LQSLNVIQGILRRGDDVGELAGGNRPAFRLNAWQIENDVRTECLLDANLVGVPAFLSPVSNSQITKGVIP